MKFKTLILTGTFVTLPFLALASPDQLAQVKAAINQDAIQRQQTLRQEFNAKREAFVQKSQERIGALKKKLGEVKAKRVEELFTAMSRKFDNAIERLNNIADRISARLDKAAAGGKNVSEQKVQLSAARDKINAAESALNDAKAQFNVMSKSGDPKTAFKKVKELVHGVAVKVKDAHSALVGVVKSLKGLELGNGGATSTPKSDN